MARECDGVIYVTREFLQRRYPSTGLFACASNVELGAQDPSVLREREERDQGVLKIGLIGELNSRLKGVDIALKALALVRDELPRFNFHILGPGDPSRFERHRAALDVSFDGMLRSGSAVDNWLRQIDLYVQPSFQEGMPRAVIEAMAQGCPVVGSNAGGLPELLDPAWIVPRGDVKALARTLVKLACDREMMTVQSRRNFEAAKAYGPDVLKPIRAAFWGEFCDIAKSRRGSAS